MTGPEALQNDCQSSSDTVSECFYIVCNERIVRIPEGCVASLMKEKRVANSNAAVKGQASPCYKACIFMMIKTITRLKQQYREDLFIRPDAEVADVCKKRKEEIRSIIEF